MKLESFYKAAFWIAIIIVLVLAVVVLRMTNKQPVQAPGENGTFITATEDVKLVEEAKEEQAEVTIPEVAEEKEEVKEETPAEEENLKVIIVKEGDTVSFPNLKAEDPDGDKITFTFSKPLNSKGEWKTKRGDAGNYKVVITASDGKEEVSDEVMIIVESSNTAPTLLINEASLEGLKEGDLVKLKITAVDAEKDPLEITYSEPFNSKGEWQTKKGDAGAYEAVVKVTDGIETITKKAAFSLEEANTAPVIDIADKLEFTEGDTVVLSPEVTDADGDPVEITYSGWMSSNEKKTDYDSEGIYDVTITASDGKSTTSKIVTVEVLNKNRPPQLVNVI
jgi:hypothetical protein